MKHTILLYYKYIQIENPEKLMKEQRSLCNGLDLKGRIIVSKEGINGTVEGLTENTEDYIKEMCDDSRFEDIHWKKSEGTGDSFPKLSVKNRKEIVSLSLDEQDINPNEMTGNRLNPEELKKWYKENKDFVIIDMRNDYELEVGKFDRTIFPGLKNFRDLPNKLEEIKDLKDKAVVTVCTGGVRCEKASGYLVSRGFKDVYQLDGGIVSYMEKYPSEEFKGSLYVFDKRIIMNFDDSNNLNKHIVIGKCKLCNKSSESYVNCKNKQCNLHFICCNDCMDKDGRPFCSNLCRKIIQRKETVNFVKNIWSNLIHRNKREGNKI